MSEKSKKQQLPEQTWKLHTTKLIPDVFGKPMADVIESLPELENKHIKPPDCTGIYLYGNVGTGKTTIAARLALAVYKDMLIDDRAKPWNEQRPTHIVLDFLTLDDFPVKMQIAVEKREYGKFMSHYFNADILIIDDLFSKNNESVNAIIKERYKNGLITIYTSNFEPDEAVKKADSSIMRRIIERCVMYKCEKYFGSGKLKICKSL